MPEPPPAKTPATAVRTSDFLQNWWGKRRQEILSRQKESGGEMVDGCQSSREYCTRLKEVYDWMRDHTLTNPPRRGTLLSHVPEWTKPLWVKDDFSEEGFPLKTILEVPRLQAALATCTSYTPSKWLLEQEMKVRYANEVMRTLERRPPADLEDMVARYKGLSGRARSWVPPTVAQGMPPKPSEDVHYAAAREQLAGLGLSGGGIRSATFCLGVLQTLAAHNLLGRFDYISSVSGGGYIHEWLAAWIHREPRGLASVQLKMSPLPNAGSLARAPEQINWLRRYSSYLTPQKGMFSADTWTAVSIWFRNTFLNQIVLFAFMAVGIVLVRGAMHPFMMPKPHNPATPLWTTNYVWQLLLALLTLVCVAWAAYGVQAFSRALASQTAKTEGSLNAPDGALRDVEVVGWVVLPGFLLSMLAALSSYGVLRLHEVAGSTSLAQIPPPERFIGLHLVPALWVVYVLALLIAQTWGGKAMETARNNNRSGSPARRAVGYAAFLLLSMAVPVTAALYLGNEGGAALRSQADIAAGALDQLFLTSKPASADQATSFSVNVSSSAAAKVTVDAPGEKAKTESKHPIQPEALVALLLPVIFFAAELMAIRLQLGLLGRSYEESRREWLARFGAWGGIFSFLWLGLGSIALVGPNLFYWFFDSGHLHAWASAGVLALIHAVTLYAGSSSKTSGTPDPRKFFGYSAIDLVGIIGAPIAILSLLIVVAGLVNVATNYSWYYVHCWVTTHAPLLPASAPGAHEGFLHNLRRLGRYEVAVSGPVLLFGIYAAVLLLFGWRVDVNEFSLHPFYRDRIARCYIGASNGRRVPDPFTGFDDHTEVDRGGIALADLVPARFGGKVTTVDGKDWPPYDGPMPIFCSTVNLTMGGDLAYQTRKGASFAFNPLWSGYFVSWTAENGRVLTTTYNSFVPTCKFAYRGATSDGTHGSSGPGIPLATVAAVSGAALSPNDGYSSQPALAFLMTLFNARLGWWIANPRKPWIWPNDMDQPTPRFGLRYLLAELCGLSNDTSNYVNLSDGGFFDNMGLYELVRRRCSLIVICDGEEDANTTFEGMGLAITKSRIDFGVEIEFPPEEIEKLAPNKDTGRSGAHFACGTIKYPAPPDSEAPAGFYTGRIIYLKTAFVGDEPVDLIHYKREHPDFPEESTINQWFTEPQFESYRRLGQLTAEKAMSSIHLRHV